MGTRSLTRFIDEEGEEFLTVYRQFDGYPSGHGQELADFLKPFRIVNGYNIEKDKAGTAANGMSCLAAQFVAAFKTEIGGIYIYAPKSKDCGEEWVYIVRPRKDQGVQMEVYDIGEHNRELLVWSGSPKDFNGEKLEKTG